MTDLETTRGEGVGPQAEAAGGAGRRRWFVRALLAVGVALLLAVLAAGVWVWRVLDAARPLVGGEVAAEGITAPVRVERDALGVPVIRGASRADVAFATGFVHAQDRFFQMDLLRRRAAGELSELFGPGAVPVDSRLRLHRFRDRARGAVDRLPRRQREVLEAYGRGVNAGLASLDGPAFEYAFLRIEPAQWEAADSILVLYSMFIELQQGLAGEESDLGLMHASLPASVFHFLTPQGTEWDAPLLGGPIEAPPLPSPGEVADLRAPAGGDREEAAPAKENPLVAALLADPISAAEPGWIPGSNAWAVAGSRTADGRAILANDMHLGLAVPNVWYRAALEWTDGGGGAVRRVTGVTLPGAPLVVVGSNGDVAWGFSNSQTDTADVVLVEALPDDPDRYRVSGGAERFRRRSEVIRIKGGGESEIEVVETRWGPLLGEDRLGRPRALRWVAHQPDAADLGLIGLETAESVDEALDVANRAGIPAQNIVVADRRGRIGWTIAGYLPRRVGLDGRLPVSWADGDRRWDGRLAPGEYPRVVDPRSGRIWTANHRIVGGELLDRVGDGGYGLAARARQIRDRLEALAVADEPAMLRIQLDDEALFLTRWQRLLLEVAAAAGEEAAPDRPYAEVRRLVEEWGGHASPGSVGYRLVREFRIAVARTAFEAVTAPVAEIDPEFSYHRVVDQYEGPLWRLVSERPAHLLDPRYGSWDALLLAALDDVLDGVDEAGAELSGWTWGARNTAAIRHPLSRVLPGGLGSFLDMPPDRLPGDSEMPRVQHPSAGASQRLVVAAGREEDGLFHMPGGQSAHPLSPHYRDGHAAWARGEPTPFLPGDPVEVLVLAPAAGAASPDAR